QIEQRFGRELPLRGTVGAFHVVGEDLELRLAVHLDAVGQKQVLVRLGGVRFLRVAAADHPPVEDAAGGPVGPTLEYLPARAAREAWKGWRLAQRGTAWSTVTWWSTCCRPPTTYSPLMAPRPPSPANSSVSVVRASRPPKVAPHVSNALSRPSVA